MRIIEGAITTLAEMGRVSTQIPELVIGGEPTYIEIPDAWVVRLAHEDGPPAKQGFLFLTRLGWAMNRGAIRDAWLTSPMDRRRAHCWAEACGRVQAIFARRDAARVKAIASLQKKIAWLKGVSL